MTRVFYACSQLSWKKKWRSSSFCWWDKFSPHSLLECCGIFSILPCMSFLLLSAGKGSILCSRKRWKGRDHLLLSRNFFSPMIKHFHGSIFCFFRLLGVHTLRSQAPPKLVGGKDITMSKLRHCSKYVLESRVKCHFLFRNVPHLRILSLFNTLCKSHLSRKPLWWMHEELVVSSLLPCSASFKSRTRACSYNLFVFVSFSLTRLWGNPRLWLKSIVRVSPVWWVAPGRWPLMWFLED